MTHIVKFSVGLILLLTLASTPVSAQEATPVTTKSEHTLIRAEALGSYPLPLVQAALANSPFADSITPEYGVDLYRLIYTTTDYAGEQVAVSGLLAVPQTDTLRGVVSYQRGTNPLRADVPSTPSVQEGLLGAAIFAGRGYLYLAADYIGGGVSTSMHPYYHADSTANAVIDLLRAAHDWTAEQGIAWPRPLLLTGFSQGGHATMAAHRALQTLDDSRFQVSASAPIAGPFNLSAISIPFSINGRAELNSLYIAYIANAYSVIYDQPLDSFLREPYAGQVRVLFDGTHSSAQISAALPSVVEELVQPEMLAQLRSGEDNWFIEAARQNDVYDWAPTAPVRLYYGERDSDVGSEHALFTAANMTALGANVQAISAGETDHAETILAVFADVVAWFDSFAPLSR
jgi:dienelactone hydrolase